MHDPGQPPGAAAFSHRSLGGEKSGRVAKLAPDLLRLTFEMSTRAWTVAGWTARALVVALFALADTSCGRKPAVEERGPAESPPPNVPPPQLETWKSMALRVEEDRGEPMGNRVRVAVPEELRHYANRHRFLAIQVAESKEQALPTPYDYGELVELIRQGGLVEMKPFGDDYVLYGVGAAATTAPFTHYDPERRVDVPLLSGYDAFEDEYNRLAASVEPIASQVELWKGERLRVPAAQKRRRATLLKRIRGGEAQIADAHKEMDRLAFYYQDYDRRRLLVGKYRALADLAARFEGKRYDIDVPEDRRAFKGRLLSYIRPEARDLILQIARDYRERFDRPLGITSLVRTEEYQDRLGEAGNPNATTISTPPHTTGLAFDLLYKFMTAVEQEAVMADIARLEDEGRVEALRENRNHIHVFVFADGQRPHESLIQASLREVDKELPVVKAAPRKAKPVARARRPARATSAKSAARRTAVRSKPAAPR